MGHFAGIKRPNFGTVSTGTLTASDLRESFLFELRQQRPLHDTSRELIRELSGVDFKDEDVEVSDVVRLIDELDKYAPSGFYFGPSLSDAADFGFWPIVAPSTRAIVKGAVQAWQRLQDIDPFLQRVEAAQQRLAGA